MTAPLLALRGVDKRFDNGTIAVQALSLDVWRGDFLSLLGPSGCGKSTVLRMIAGLVEPTAGSIGRAGVPAEAGARHDGELSFVFQEPTLMPWATVFENVHLPLRLKGVSRRTARDEIRRALSMVHLEGIEDAYPRELSGGMKMRVSIARALVTHPTLLLMDEPFAALDEITRFKLNDDLLELWDELGCTIVFVTHSVFESVYLSTRIAVLAARPGRLHAQIAVDAPYPREERFRTSAHYAARCRETSEALHAAMHAQAA